RHANQRALLLRIARYLLGLLAQEIGGAARGARIEHQDIGLQLADRGAVAYDRRNDHRIIRPELYQIEASMRRSILVLLSNRLAANVNFDVTAVGAQLRAGNVAPLIRVERMQQA